ncbi:MAG: hypothetical protein F4Z77_13220 [Dehalococcoidia bacterium]|nr:hypothetical protein [Chloroflexota bacterium]MXW27234.1 hypothetical protein [Dehalococcoidia bacterium]MYA54534.1 hypothetical protein [Dehalococcoidia bacterium]
MAAIHRLFAVYLLLVGVAVGAYFVISPLYAGQGNLADASEVWDILNWFMAVAAVLLVLITFVGTRSLADDASGWDKFVAYGRFHLAVALLLGFLNNWFASQWGEGGFEPIGFVWVLVNTAMSILAVEMAIKLWREPHAPFGARD